MSKPKIERSGIELERVDGDRRGDSGYEVVTLLLLVPGRARRGHKTLVAYVRALGRALATLRTVHHKGSGKGWVMR